MPGKHVRLVFLTQKQSALNHPRVKATQAIVNRFQQQTNIEVKLVAIGAAAAVITTLGRQTFSRRGLSLVEANGKPVAVPSDSWTQLLVYRKDLFGKAGLATSTSFQAIRAAAGTLTRDGMAGIVAATKADDSFTQQTFEYLAVANGCQLTDQAGAITLTSKLCRDTFGVYVDLIHRASVQGGQDATSTRAAYLAGRQPWASGRRFSWTSWPGSATTPAPAAPNATTTRRFSPGTAAS